MPRCSSASRPSGRKPSPHALSIGGLDPSATTTRKPRCRAVIAAARPAGPPPITKMSVEDGTAWLISDLPLEQQQLRTKPRPHGRQYAKHARFGAPIAHHILEHNEYRRRRKIPDPLQAIPRSIELAIVQIERSRRCLQHFRAAGVQHPISNVAALMSVVGKKCVHIPPEIFANQRRDFR